MRLTPIIGVSLWFLVQMAMISRVVIKNFKSIGEVGVDLELKPLTLLVGPNGGGKSSILEAIAVASQGNLSGPLITFPNSQSLVHMPDASTGLVEVHFTPTHPDFSPGFRWTFGKQGSRIYLLNSDKTDHPEIREKIDALLTGLQSRAFLLSSVRGDVPFSADTRRDDPDWVGLRGQDLLLLLVVIFGQRRYDDIADDITRWAGRFGVSGLKAGWRGQFKSGSDYEDTELKAVLDLALASSGARQILTVITQLFWAPEGSLLMIEEPEISLHPQAQVDVLEMFGEAIREHKQIIATTHSVFMLQALGYAVHKGWLKPEEIAVYHIEKGERGSVATALPLDEHGYIQDWIPSFTEVERRLMREWAETLPRV